MAKNITKAKHRFPLRHIRRIPRFFRLAWPILFLSALSLVIAYLNYEPGTYLSGWDNLHPEFDTKMNFFRSLYSVWQEYRGVGLLSGQAPAADLPRIILIALFQGLNIPQYLLRYLTTFLPLVLGPLGVYLLFYHHLFREKLDSATTQFASFFGGLFYLLNLNTLQTFFVPFETFTWFYGALPFLLYFTLSYLKKPSLDRFFTLFIISLLAAPSFYVETIFLIFFVTVTPFFIEYFYHSKKSFHSLKTISFSFLSLIIPHLFWLFPVIFFVLTKGNVVETAKINNISSPETYFRNLQFSTIKDLALIKGYLFNYLDMSADFKYDYLLSVWRQHLANPLISIIGFLTFTTAITGFYYSLKKNFAWTKAFIGTLAVCLFFLLGGGLLVNRSIPLIGELFRSPFTKFSIPFSLAYSFFFAIGTIFILDIFTFLHSRLTYLLTLFTITTALFIFASPVFSGNLISSKIRLRIPTEYFDLFTYLKAQDPATRIANFPQNDFWGWLYYDWGYRGSGFLWQGIKQPLLDRAFDVWEKTNENYYGEISTAIYSDDQQAFESVIDKYAIDWILLDKHVVAADGKADLGTTNLEKFLTDNPKFTLSKSFGDNIYLFRTDISNKVHNFLSLSNSNTDIQYPFSSLSLRPNTDWIKKGGYLSLSAEALITTSSATLNLPSFSDTESLIPVRVEYLKSGNSLRLRLSPITPVVIAESQQIDLRSTPLEITIPTDKNNLVLRLDQNYFQIILPAELQNLTDYQPLSMVYLPPQKSFNLSLYDSTPENSYDLLDSLQSADPAQCYLKKPNRKIEKISTPNSISLLGTDIVGCLSAPIPGIPGGTLISLNFTYSSPTLTLGNANISGKDLASQAISQPLESRKDPRRAQVFASSSGKYQQANFILEASDTKSVQEIEYQDIVLSTHPLLFSSFQKLAAIPAKEINLSTGLQDLQVSLPLTSTNLDIVNTAQSNSLLPENLNCDQFNQGKTVKVISSDKIVYQSQNAIECDYQNLRHLPHSLNYLIVIDSQNNKGLPLTLCLENFSTRRCEIYDRLFDKNVPQYLVDPVSDPQESTGYTLHLFNQSVGNRITTNTLKSLSIHPIPLRFIKAISIKVPGEKKEKAEITTTHSSEFLYTASISSQGEQTLNLYQTSSPYWMAYRITQSDAKLPLWLLTTKILLFPPTSLPHIDNGTWYNSWSLPFTTLSTVIPGNDPESIQIVLIYLPQYLEFIGLFFLTAPIFIFIFIKLLATKKASH